MLTQSESYMMTVSAEAKLIPKPPALVLNRKMKLSESLLLYSLMSFCRVSNDLLPSRRLYLKKK